MFKSKASFKSHWRSFLADLRYMWQNQVRTYTGSWGDSDD